VELLVGIGQSYQAMRRFDDAVAAFTDVIDALEYEMEDDGDGDGDGGEDAAAVAPEPGPAEDLKSKTTKVPPVRTFVPSPSTVLQISSKSTS
jgi:hypothetical protein